MFILFIRILVNLLCKQMRVLNCLRVILGHAQNVFLLLMLHFLIVKNKE